MRNITIPDTARPSSIAELLAAPALPFPDVARVLDLPISTLDKLHSRGEGPKVFLIGRRRYVLQSDLHAWLERLAAPNAPAAAPASAPTLSAGTSSSTPAAATSASMPKRGRGRPRRASAPAEV